MKKQKININNEMIIQRDKQISRLEQILRDIAIILYSVSDCLAEKRAVKACGQIEYLIFDYFHPNVHFKKNIKESEG